MRHAWFDSMALLLLLAVGCPAAHSQHFRGGQGLQALDDKATGIYELGWVQFNGIDATVTALLHGGQVLQVHASAGGTWLPKRSGSQGGKKLSATDLAKLADVAGGTNRNVRMMVPEVQKRFAAAAGLFWLDAPAAGIGQQASAARLASTALRWVLADAAAGDCGPIGCRTLHAHASATGGFRLGMNEAGSEWGFEGYGIVALWAVPPVAASPKPRAEVQSPSP